MTLEETCELSYYREIAVLNREHGVTLVQHMESGRIFVKKVLVTYDAEVFRYLQRRHVPHTPEIYAVVEDGDRLTVIEEYISGRSLREILDREGTLTETRAEDIIKQLCEILQHLHNASPPIIHRDIKPSNVIVSSEGTVTLLDMDAAKWEREDEARDTRLIGTVGYAAPEQYGFGASTVQTDLYSLGVLLNVMLTGGFPNESPAQGRLGKAVLSCTRMEPRSRPASAGALLRLLDGDSGRRDPGGRRGWTSFLPPGFRIIEKRKSVAIVTKGLMRDAAELISGNSCEGMDHFKRFDFVL